MKAATANKIIVPLIECLKFLDQELRNAAAKCTECQRPDGGVVYANETRQAAGLVDRRRCTSPGCPAKHGAGENRSLIVSVGAPRP